MFDLTMYLQIKKPILVKDPSYKTLMLLKEAYRVLPSVRKNVKDRVPMLKEFFCSLSVPFSHHIKNSMLIFLKK